jgi:hypothetical protein
LNHTGSNLVGNGSRIVTLHALFNDKTLNLVPIRKVLGPHNGIVCYDRIARPSFSSIHYVTSLNLLGGGFHASGVTTVLGLGKTEAAELLESDKVRKESLFLLITTALLKNLDAKAILEEHEESETHIEAPELIEHGARFNEVELLIDRGSAILMTLQGFRNLLCRNRRRQSFACLQPTKNPR